MKKFLPIVSIFLALFAFSLFSPSSSFAICIMPSGYDPEGDPDINLDLSGWEEIDGLLDQFPFVHETDPRAPQLSTLIEGICDLAINSVNMISGTDRPPAPDIPADYANLVCFSTPAGAPVLVPNSGYNMGGGCEAAVLYATSHSIVLKYTPDDNIVSGYTVYINNFQVDPNLLAYYNQQHNSGRTEMPCLSGGERIGLSSGKTCVVIRDRGTFMDPRWQEWWNQCPATALELILKLIDLCLTGENGLPPNFFPSNSLVCTPDLVGDQDSRPYYNYNCDLCNLTGLFCPSCATSFTVFDEVSWEWRDKDEECESDVWVTREWPESPPGTIQINPSDTKIPFVGKKGEESEEKYLADYFEGTNEYYEDYPMYWRDWINYAGVWRKLSPMGYQDQLKKQMVERALTTSDVQSEGVHHYQLEYRGRICWDLPLLIDALLAYAESHNIPIVGKLIDALYRRSSYCVFEGSVPGVTLVLGLIKDFNRLSPLDITYFHTTDASGKLTSLEGHYPPDPLEENYSEKWDEWKESDGGWWYKLWQVVPMFSHEDTPGMIIPYLGSKPLDTFGITNPENQVEKVPHVARLYESTQEVQKMLVPSYEENLTLSQKPSEPIIASAKNSQSIITSPTEKNVLGEKKLLAQNQWDACDPDGDCCATIAIQSICCSGGTGTVVIDGRGCGHAWVTINGQFMGINALGPGMTYHFGCPTNPGATVNVSVAVVNYNIPIPGGHYTVSQSCSMTLDQDGAACCGGPPVPPGPICGLPEALPVNQCEMEAITDANPNDDLCCDPINIELTAVDMFINENYTECSDYTCGPNGTSLCPDDPCLNKETREVNREIGVTLLHPYLTDIWEQTGLADTAGLFNIFRPEDENIPKFKEIDASSEIVYTQSGFDAIAPSIGKFYFNYLGGVQLAKEWVTRALRPWKE